MIRETDHLYIYREHKVERKSFYVLELVNLRTYEIGHLTYNPIQLIHCHLLRNLMATGLY